MATLKLLIATNTADFFLSHRLLLAQQAQKEAYEVHLVAPESPLRPKIESLGFQFHPLEMSRKGINPFNEILTVLTLAKLFKTLRPDVFHGFTIKPVIYGLLACYLSPVARRIVTITGLGYVFINQGLKGRILRFVAGYLYKVALAKAHTVIFQNPDDMNLFTENGWTTLKRCQIIPGTGVDTQRFSPKPPLEPEPCTFVFPARFLTDKGIRELIWATQDLAQQGLRFQVLLCGRLDPGNPASITQGELNDFLNIPGVRLMGYVKDMSQEYLVGRVALLPSYREGISLSLIEATSSGLMLITTDAPGCRDLVQGDPANGLLVPVGDARALSESMRWAIDHEDERLEMGRRSRQMALARFEVSQITQMNTKLYRSQ